MSQIPDDYNKGGYYTFLGTMAFVVVFFIVLVAFVMPDLTIGQNIQQELHPGAAAKDESLDANAAAGPNADEGASENADSETEAPAEEE